MSYRIVPHWHGLAILISCGALVCGCGKTASTVPPAPASPATATSASGVAADAIVVVGAKDLERLLAEHRGKVIVLNFWATWCPPCVAEMPYFAAFYEKSDKSKVALISLSADGEDNIESAVRPFKKEHKLPFPVYVLRERDPEAFKMALGTELSGALPATVIYDAAGKVRYVWERDTTLEELNKVVGALLS